MHSGGHSETCIHLHFLMKLHASNDQFELSDPRVKTTVQLNPFQSSPIHGSLSGKAAVHMSLTRWQ